MPDNAADDNGDLDNRIAALRLALATVTDSYETLRTIVDAITERGGCWGCIAREILTVPADLTDDTGISYIEAQLAEALDQAQA